MSMAGTGASDGAATGSKTCSEAMGGTSRKRKAAASLEPESSLAPPRTAMRRCDGSEEEVILAAPPLPARAHSVAVRAVAALADTDDDDVLIADSPDHDDHDDHDDDEAKDERSAEDAGEELEPSGGGEESEKRRAVAITSAPAAFSPPSVPPIDAKAAKAEAGGVYLRYEYGNAYDDVISDFVSTPFDNRQMMSLLSVKRNRAKIKAKEAKARKRKDRKERKKKLNPAKEMEDVDEGNGDGDGKGGDTNTNSKNNSNGGGELIPVMSQKRYLREIRRRRADAEVSKFLKTEADAAESSLDSNDDGGDDDGETDGSNGDRGGGDVISNGSGGAPSLALNTAAAENSLHPNNNGDRALPQCSPNDAYAIQNLKMHFNHTNIVGHSFAVSEMQQYAETQRNANIGGTGVFGPANNRHQHAPSSLSSPSQTAYTDALAHARSIRAQEEDTQRRNAAVPGVGHGGAYYNAGYPPSTSTAANGHPYQPPPRPYQHAAPPATAVTVTHNSHITYPSRAPLAASHRPAPTPPTHQQQQRQAQLAGPTAVENGSTIPPITPLTPLLVPSQLPKPQPAKVTHASEPLRIEGDRIVYVDGADGGVANLKGLSRLPVGFGFLVNEENGHDDVASKLEALTAVKRWKAEGRKAMANTSAALGVSTKWWGASGRTSPKPEGIASAGSTKTGGGVKNGAKNPSKPSPLVSDKSAGIEYPDGWTIKTYLRTGGATAGGTDRYWYSPIRKFKFRSKTKVKLFVEILAEPKIDGDEALAYDTFRKRGNKP